MTKKIITVASAIDKIVQDDIDSIRQELQSKVEPIFLIDILLYGTKGVNDYTLLELQTELDSRFDNRYIINPEL